MFANDILVKVTFASRLHMCYANVIFRQMQIRTRHNIAVVQIFHLFWKKI